MLASIGETLVDNIGNKTFLGGCPYNVALACSRLGGSATYFGKISSDQYGLQFIESFLDNGILFDPDLCNSPLKTASSTVVFNSKGDPSYNFYWENSACANISSKELIESFNNYTDIDIVFIGSIALSSKPGIKTIIDSVNFIEPKPLIFLDPNIRLSMVSDVDKYSKEILELASHCDIVKASNEDIAQLFLNLDEKEAINLLLSHCKKHLIITSSEDGATWYSKNCFTVSCPKLCLENNMSVKGDSVGCGDVFSGALIAALQLNNLISKVPFLTQDEVKKLLDKALFCAAFNALQEGCNPPSSLLAKMVF
ncbi:MAG: hypothetical protein HUK24_00490 [Sphaerochaetaceae bacterium]|nr:hypothetical protein [Sphaerochaetaceae bacterium]